VFFRHLNLAAFRRNTFFFAVLTSKLLNLQSSSLTLRHDEPECLTLVRFYRLAYTSLGRHDTQHNDIQDNETQHNTLCHYAECCILSIVMLSVLLLSVVVLNVGVLSVVASSGVMVVTLVVPVLLAYIRLA